MGLVRADPELAAEDFGVPAAGPDLPPEARGFRLPREPGRDPPPLVLGGLGDAPEQGRAWRAVGPPVRAAANPWRTAASVTPRASALGRWVQPRGFSSRARRRRASFPSCGGGSWVTILPIISGGLGSLNSFCNAQ
jgi:hypothetical protein